MLFDPFILAIQITFAISVAAYVASLVYFIRNPKVLIALFTTILYISITARVCLHVDLDRAFLVSEETKSLVAYPPSEMSVSDHQRQALAGLAGIGPFYFNSKTARHIMEDHTGSKSNYTLIGERRTIDAICRRIDELEHDAARAVLHNEVAPWDDYSPQEATYVINHIIRLEEARI